MPSLCPFLRVLASALLLALPILSSPAASQETAPSATNAPPTVNATNATEWVMSPEVEKLLDDGGAFDESCWRYFTHPNDMPLIRVHPEFDSGTYNGVCIDCLANIRLWDGLYYLGCSWPRIHPKHPHPERFTVIDWENIDPAEHLEIIKDIYIDDWERMAPIVRKSIMRNEEHIVLKLQRSTLDITNTGNYVTVYRLAFFPRNLCRGADNTINFLWKYYIADNVDYRDYIKIHLNGELFYYMNTIYYINTQTMKIYKGVKSRSGIPFAIVCGFTVK